MLGTSVPVLPDGPELKRVLETIARRYPPDLIDAQLADVDRIAFNLRLVLSNVPKDGTVCDIGGGVGLFSVACAAMGLTSWLIDDFADEVNERYRPSTLELHREFGVNVLSLNVLETPLPIEPQAMHAVTAFDVLEHFHHSPRRLLHSLVQALVPEGILLISTPNSANLKKRIGGVFGRTSWSSFDAWYYRPVFRGHVREPSLADLMGIGRDLELQGLKTFGRNWLGYNSPRSAVRFATRLSDRILARRPSLCSDLYLMGFAPDKNEVGRHTF